MTAINSLCFDSGFGLLPSGMPLDGWQTMSGSLNGDAYHVMEDGALVLKPSTSNLILRSNDASGGMNLSVDDGNGRRLYQLSAKVHLGKVIHIDQVHQPDGFRWKPTWFLDKSICEPSPGNDVEELVAIIRACNAYRLEVFDSEQLRLMVALALCRSDLLKGTPAALAWRKLTPSQIAAISTWWY